jgi:hypothetical protein
LVCKKKKGIHPEFIGHQWGINFIVAVVILGVDARISGEVSPFIFGGFLRERTGESKENNE